MSPVTINKLLVLFLFSISQNALAKNPCAGNGTVIYFINGLFNTSIQSVKNRKLLEHHLKGINPNKLPIKYKNAFVRQHNKIFQLTQAMLQRGVDDLQQGEGSHQPFIAHCSATCNMSRYPLKTN